MLRPLQHILSGFTPSLVMASLSAFPLQASKEALCYSLIPTITLPAHTADSL
jgi:hypothetical protein